MDFTVSYPELRGAGDQFENMQTTGEGLVTRLQGVPLVQSDFGRIPWLQTRVWEAYCEHTTDCADALQELAETLGKIHEGLDATADAYEDFETNAAQASSAFYGQVI